ncbi:hypothetical protein DASC09_007380 [Saccharomycopsis crataegensis]|uniref:Mso1 N-terminal domain-containing protein n=1 Tax=Saccharomycopsis crataegensis TaxID=43959 RepID=A0AAV5QF98_9ASCO|nr:hypothetical protein DASC09_007380 [Saccharomycopsis crataegensis]
MMDDKPYKPFHTHPFTMQQNSFWNKVKKNASNINISNLSIGNDSDGKAEYESLVHKSLVNFYQEHAGGQCPDWLVENDPNFNQNVNNFQHTNLPSNNKFYPVSNNRPGDGRAQNSNGSYQPNSYSNRPGGNNDGYNNSNNNSGGSIGSRMGQSVKTQTPASASFRDMYKSSRTSNGSPQSSNQPVSVNRANSSIGDRLRQRGTTSSATANRLQSNWSRR